MSEIKVKSADLARELKLLKGVVGDNKSIPILGMVMLDSGTLSATDLDVSLRTSVEAEGSGTLLLNAKKLAEISKALGDGLTIRVLPDAWAELESGQSKFKIAGLPVEDFPTLPNTDGEGISLPADVLHTLIGRVSYAITNEDARYYLAWALLIIEPSGLSMVATDGHRMAYSKIPVPIGIEEPKRVLVPRRAVSVIKALIEAGEESIRFSQSGTHLIFAGSRTLTSKTVEGQFPAFEKVIAWEPYVTATVGRDALRGAVSRVALIASERTRAVKLSLASGRLTLSSADPGFGEAQEWLGVETDKSGPTPVEFGVNASYVLDSLGSIETEHIILGAKDSESQINIRPTEGDQVAVIMPMRL